MSETVGLRIRQALLDAAEADYWQALASAPEIPFSAQYLRWEGRFLDHPVSMAKGAFRTPWQRVLRTAACFVLVLSLSFGTLMAGSPHVRAVVATWIGIIDQTSITEIDVTIYLSGSGGCVYTSETFHCVEENGNTLQYWFENTGTDSCSVQLYRVGFPRDQYAGEAITVNAGEDSSGVYRNPGNGIFYLRVTCTSGIGSEMNGTLRAVQIDLPEE